MRRITSALRDAGHAGESLPPVFEAFENHGVHFKLGELHLVASAPGVGKSLLARTIAVRSGVPTLYVSADTSPHVTSVSLAAMLSGHPQAYVEQHLKSGRYDEILAGLDHIRWSFQACPSIDDIVADMQSFAVLYGDFPHHLIIDNLSNCFSEDEEYAGYRRNMEAFQTMASETGSAVTVLHHLVGRCEDGTTRPSLADIEGKVGKRPGLVLTLFNGKSGDLGFCVVKNRGGAAAPNGGLYGFLKTDKERARLG